jgi:hypothetical protein
VRVGALKFRVFSQQTGLLDDKALDWEKPSGYSGMKQYLVIDKTPKKSIAKRFRRR